jgi:site-specific DNA recombinase
VGSGEERQQKIRFTISRDEQGNALNRTHRRRFLLSGLLICGCCGGGYTIVGIDRYGCATRRSKGTCSNTFTIRRHEIEERVFAGLRERMMAPELVAAFVDEFNAELRRLAGETAAERDAAQRMLAQADRKIAGIVKAIEDGAYSSVLKDRLALFERQKAEAAARLAAAAKTQPVLRLHPNASALYKAKLEQLGTALNDPGIAAEAGDVMRDLIERIVLTPADGALKIELYGDLARLMAFAEGTERKTNDPGPGGSGSLLSVVAGTGFEPVTFRL